MDQETLLLLSSVRVPEKLSFDGNEKFGRFLPLSLTGGKKSERGKIGKWKVPKKTIENSEDYVVIIYQNTKN